MGVKALASFRFRLRRSLWDHLPSEHSTGVNCARRPVASSGAAPKMVQMIDSTVIRAHIRRRAQKGGSKAVSWPFARRLYEQSHARTNGEGLPLAFVITGGEAHEATIYGELKDLHETRPKALLTDKGYDSDVIREEAWFHGTDPVIPTNSNRKIQRPVDPLLYVLRNRIERFFKKLKNARRVATRYDKTPDSFLAFVQLASIKIWLRFVNRTQSNSTLSPQRSTFRVSGERFEHTPPLGEPLVSASSNLASSAKRRANRYSSLDPAGVATSTHADLERALGIHAAVS
jgi:transposase